MIINKMSNKNDFDLKKEIIKYIQENEGTDFFTDQYGEPWMSFNSPKKYNTIKCKSSQMVEFIKHLSYVLYKSFPSKQSIEDIQDIFFHIAKNKSDVKTIGYRVMWGSRSKVDGSNIIYDLADDEGNIVCIDKDGWRILKNDRFKFKNFPHSKRQVKPIEGGKAEIIFDFLNITDKNQRLMFLVWMASTLVPDIPHPIAYIYGPQGSAKSTISRITRDLLDPSLLETSEFPSEVKELVQHFDHHHVIFFDNVSFLNHKLSDSLAKSVTGFGFSKRVLYKDDDDKIYNFKKCIGINGINLHASKPDLLERCILFPLEPIKNRKIEADILEEYKTVKTMILGSVFSALSYAIKNIDSAPKDNLPRMADFSRWGYALAEGFGYKGEEFFEAYKESIEKQHIEALAESCLAQAIFCLLQEKNNKWEGTPTELVKALKSVNNWSYDNQIPNEPNKLSSKLNEIKLNLEKEGVVVTRSKGIYRKITLYKLPN